MTEHDETRTEAAQEVDELSDSGTAIDLAEEAPDEAEPAEAEVLLEVKELTLKFGGLQALDGVSFDIRRGE
ncbi:MAG: ABC transporter ATP-binding protein, partial [[Mycobacterium] stephanolepidis]